MNVHTLTFVTADAPDDAASRWAQAVLDRWPGSRPRLDVMPLDRVFEEWSESVFPPPTRGPVLVVLGTDITPVTLYQLVDLLHRTLTPGAILLPRLDEASRTLQTGGVLVQPWDVDAGFLAAALFALSERQSVVGSLSRELTIAMRQHGGFRGEIDRMHDELNLAAAIQTELLPKSLPALPTLELGVIFRPVGYVSGDIYDAQQLDERHVGFFIADAVGHGVPAALMTMVISRCLGMTRTVNGERQAISPAEAMSRLNAELLRGRRQSPRFGTAVYGVADTRTHEVSVCGAGHPPPLRIMRDGRVERIETDGPLLGVFPDEEYRQTTFTLRPGETLLLYSDGLETAFCPPNLEPRARRHARHVEEIGELAWIDPARGRTLPDAMADLAERIDRQDGSLHQVDDITVLALAALKEPVEQACQAVARAA
jgi:sigma-B regulation protein RsbU (phosphoserine phosphatase)